VTTVLNTVIPILAGLSLLGFVIFVLRGLQARGGAASQAYGVARQEARQEMLVSFSRAAVFFLVALILFGIYGLSPRPEIVDVEPTPTATVTPNEPPTATATIAATRTPAATSAAEEPTATNTVPPELATETPDATAEVTQTPSVPTAVVNSPNGLWLRERPGGTQELELIPDGTVLTLLDGRETVDDLEWQEVRTPAGNEGWVAVEFIIYQ
jgi:hypothetical protein